MIVNWIFFLEPIGYRFIDYVLEEDASDTLLFDVVPFLDEEADLTSFLFLLCDYLLSRGRGGSYIFYSNTT